MLTWLSISTNQNIGETTMEPFYLLFYAFVIFGHTIPFTDAGLLEPLRNIFESNKHRTQKNQVLQPFLSPLRGSKQVPAPDNFDFDQNKPSPLDNQNLPLGQADNLRIISDDPKARGLNPNGWWPEENTHPHDVLTKKPPENIPDYDKIVQDAFPEASQLLDKLKKLNHIKEMQRLRGHHGLVTKGQQASKPVQKEQRIQVEKGPEQSSQTSNSQLQSPETQNPQVLSPEAQNSQAQNDVNQYGQNEVGQNGLGSNELGQNELGPNELGQNGLGPNELGQSGQGQNGQGQNGQGQNGQGQNGLGQNESEQNGQQQNGVEQSGLGGGNNPFSDKETTSTSMKSYNYEDIKDLLNNEIGITTIPDMTEKVLMKKLTKRRFYHQARPVRPENERNDSNETIYYT